MLRRFLNLELERRQKKNPKYSIRGFARDLKIESSMLSKIIKGTRPIKPLTAFKVLERLDIDLSLKNIILLSLFPENQQVYADDRDFRELTADVGSLPAAWEFYAVLSLAELPEFIDDADWVAHRLATTSEVTALILQKLKELNLIAFKDNRWSPTGIQLTTTPGARSQNTKEAQKQYIEKSVTHLMRKFEEEIVSDFSGITMAVTKSKIPEAVRRIKEFRRNLATFLHETQSYDSVYRINIQLFPLTENQVRRQFTRAQKDAK